MKYYVVGLTDTPCPYFTPEVGAVIGECRVFAGGKRHHQIVESFIPHDSVWIDITVPLTGVFTQFRAKEQEGTPCIVVFASGDPLFFGFANTLQREIPEADIVVYPAFNSLQMLAHKMLMPYHDMRIVSLTGRDWHEFDRALIEGWEHIVF